ncbi:MAG: hypothetical protein V3R64_00460, partial [Sphingomonadales bacterium]
MVWQITLIIIFIALVDLAITFILFKHLSSWAKGHWEGGGHKIAYGGALAGFVLIFFLLTQTVFSFIDIVNSNEETSINLDGQWIMYFESPEDTANRTKLGTAFIEQEKKSSHFIMRGTIESSVENDVE